MSKIEDQKEKARSKGYIDNYINEIETLYYNKPESTTFLYYVELKDNEVKNLNNSRELTNQNTNYKLYYREEIGVEPNLIDIDNNVDIKNEKKK